MYPFLIDPRRCSQTPRCEVSCVQTKTWCEYDNTFIYFIQSNMLFTYQKKIMYLVLNGSFLIGLIQFEEFLLLFTSV